MFQIGQRVRCAFCPEDGVGVVVDIVSSLRGIYIVDFPQGGDDLECYEHELVAL